MSTPSELIALVERFDHNRAAYRSPGYNETQVRREFIDPFFELLGWDVTNKQGYAEAYKDVIHEDAIKIGGSHKAPDYSFRIGGTRKFFVEAKAPWVNLDADPKPAYQLRRYAWSANLPLSILTDFEEFSVYDGHIKPEQHDSPTKARFLRLTYQDYPTHWDELVDRFSKDAVLKGSFDQYAQARTTKRGTATVDAVFLRQIESWRENLARTLVNRNPQLTQRQLNFAVQITIDRIIFLRMAEDRGIEPYGRLQELLKGRRVYDRLQDLYRQADERYNSGLFHFRTDHERPESPDTLTPTLTISDESLKAIIAGLYYPESPYEFSVLPVDVLGHVYEQFLGKVIRLSGRQVEIEEKPEVRKAGGVYYTPTFIVDEIVRQTIGTLLEGQKPGIRGGGASKLKIIDPACGSGSFLIGAYQYLLDWHRDRYLAEGAQKHTKELYQGPGGQWFLTTAEKKRILLNNIYGVDIDPQAVEVTKLSLLLKVLEGESSQSLGTQLRMFHERALPDLDNNIKCGNSLIGPEFYQTGQLSFLSEEEAYRINVFDWRTAFPNVFEGTDPGFDAVIGNPPYIRIQALTEWAPLEVEYYKRAYCSASKGNYDIYVAFVERGLSLLNRQGQLGFILPHKFFNAQYGEPLREVIAKGRHLAGVVHFGDEQVFVGPTTYTCLLFLDKAGSDAAQVAKVDDLDAWRITGSAEVGSVPAERINGAAWNFVIGNGAALFDTLERMPIKLGDAAHIFVGLQTSADKTYVLRELSPAADGFVRVCDKSGGEWCLEQAALRPFLNDVTVATYERLISRHWLVFPYRIAGDKAFLISPNELVMHFPRVWEYLNANSEILRGRENGKADNDQWYGYIYRKNLTLFDTPKLIVQVISQVGRYAFDDTGLYFTGGGNGPYYGVRWKNDQQSLSLHYLQALLGSHLLDFVLHHVSSPFRGGYWSYGKRFIEQLPIRTIDLSNPSDKACHDQVVVLVERMLAMHKQLAQAQTGHEQAVMQRQIAAMDQRINQFVYELYGLTEAEIALVEGATNPIPVQV